MLVLCVVGFLFVFCCFVFLLPFVVVWCRRCCCHGLVLFFCCIPLFVVFGVVRCCPFRFHVCVVLRVDGFVACLLVGVVDGVCIVGFV